MQIGAISRVHQRLWIYSTKRGRISRRKIDDIVAVKGEIVDERLFWYRKSSLI